MQLRNTAKIASLAFAAWATVGAQAIAADDATITGIQMGVNQVEILLDGSAEGASVSAFTEAEPDRAIVDMLGVSLGILHYCRRANSYDLN